MNLLVCFKIIPDLDQMTPGDFSPGVELNIDTSFVKTMINCFDESGLEFGLRLADQGEKWNVPCTKTAFTMGGDQADLTLKTLLALRYDHALRMELPSGDLRFSPQVVASAIANYAKEGKNDLILLGRQAPPGNSGLTPALVSAEMGVPLVANVVDLQLISADLLELTTEEDGCLYTSQFSLPLAEPLVVSVGNAVISKLRVPTLRDRMQYGKRDPEVRSALENTSTSVTLEGLSLIKRSRNGEVLEGDAESLVAQCAQRFHQKREEFAP